MFPAFILPINNSTFLVKANVASTGTARPQSHQRLHRYPSPLHMSSTSKAPTQNPALDVAGKPISIPSALDPSRPSSLFSQGLGTVSARTTTRTRTPVARNRPRLSRLSRSQTTKSAMFCLPMVTKAPLMTRLLHPPRVSAYRSSRAWPVRRSLLRTPQN